VARRRLKTCWKFADIERKQTGVRLKTKKGSNMAGQITRLGRFDAGPLASAIGARLEGAGVGSGLSAPGAGLHKHRVSIRLSVCLLACALVLSGCSGSSSESSKQAAKRASPPDAPVSMAVAVERDVPIQLQAIGHVVPFSTVAVRSQVDGTLEGVHFKEGAEVKRDELIFTIDTPPYDAALNQAKGTWEKDIALSKNAAVEVSRNAALLKNGIVSQDTYDQSRAAAEALEATLVADKAAVESAELQLSYCYIRSPIGGRLGTLQVNAGNIVKKQDTVLVTIHQLKPVYVDFSLPEQELPRLRDYAAAGKLRVEAHPSEYLQPSPAGELAVINNIVDTATGTILLRAVFPNENEILWPGQFVNTVLTLATQTNAVVVPSPAVQVGQLGEFVFVIKSDLTVDARPVKTGSRVDEEIVLRQGVQPGEQVVISGQLRLAPGVKVQIQNVSRTPQVTAAP
jgi:membrane fusion protein, multidrug efflux system